MADYEKNDMKDTFIDISSSKPVKVRRKGELALRITSLVLSIVLIIFGSGLLYYYSILSSLNFVDITGDPSSTTAKSSTAASTSQDSTLPDFSQLDVDEELLDDSKILNIMLFGEDNAYGAEYGRSDSMIMLSIDNRHKKIKLTSFMRDSYINVEGHGLDKLTHAYAYGGPKLAIQTIESNFGIKVDRYAKVDFTTFTEIIDILGGIDIELNQEEIDYINHCLYVHKQSNSRTKITDPPGIVHLNGQEALWYSRDRGLYTSYGRVFSGDDWDRTTRQRKLLETVFNDMKDADIGQILSIVSKVAPLVTTNLKKDEITALAYNSTKYLKYSVEQYTVPEEGQWYYIDDSPVGSVIAYKDLDAQKKLFAEFVYEDLVKDGKIITE